MARIKFNFSGSKRDFATIKGMLESSHYISATLRGRTKAFTGTTKEGEDPLIVAGRLKDMGATKITIE
jgi:hypothetical protein